MASPARRSVVETHTVEDSPVRRSYRSGTILIAITAFACLAALLFRTEIRSRYWAAQLIQAATPADRAIPLTLLCNSGDAAWWGIETLLSHPDDEIRQYGVLVIQHLKSPRSRQRLLALLEDDNVAVRELAALGLAIQGDDSVIPTLVRIYSQGDMDSAASACVALERLGSPAAAAALSELSVSPRDPERSAALIDALTGIGTPRCAAALLRFLDDDRPCQSPERLERMIEQLGPIIQKSGLPMPSQPAPGDEPAPTTVAERAAAGLSRITGLTPPYTSALPDEERKAATQVWSAWISEHKPSP
jgi:hypothetical protein